MSANVVACAACAIVLAASARAEDTRADARLDAILAACVRHERVDYPLLRAKYLEGLRTEVQRLSALDLTHVSREAGMARDINLYNATVLTAVAERYHPGYSVAERDFALFKQPLVATAREKVSLNDWERQIRERYHDPRVHVALNCAAVSCPPLRPQAYRAEDLDRVLDENVRAFLHDRTRNPIDWERRRLRLSAIFDWYAEDFGGHAQLPAFVTRYLGRDLGQFTLSFVDYSWKLNEAE